MTEFVDNNMQIEPQEEDDYQLKYNENSMKNPRRKSSGSDDL